MLQFAFLFVAKMLDNMLSTATITITAYAETKEESNLINDYLKNRPSKFKRIIHKK